MRGRASVVVGPVLVALGVAAWLGGLGPAQVSTAGALTASTTNVGFHNSKHSALTSTPLGSTVHPFVAVTGTGGTPTGSVIVALYSGNSCSGSPRASSSPTALSAGVADMTGFPISPGAVGSLSIKATYGGSGTFASSVSKCAALTVTKATPSIAFEVHSGAHAILTSVFIGQFVHVRVALTGSAGTPTGQATLRVHQGTDCTGTVQLSRTIDIGATGIGETTAFAFDAATTRSLEVIYDGNASYNARTSACKQVEWMKLPPEITPALHLDGHTSVTSVVVGTRAHPRVSMGGKLDPPTGTVDITFMNGEDCPGLGTPVNNLPLVNGVLDDATLLFTQQPVGRRSLKVHYDGDASYTPGDACLNFTVTKAPSDPSISIHNAAHVLMVQIDPGELIHPNLSIKGASNVAKPGGQADVSYHAAGCGGPATQTVHDVSVVGGAADAPGLAIVAAPGTHAFSVHYSGDVNYQPSDECTEFSIAAPPTKEPTFPPPTAAPTSPPNGTPRPTTPGATTAPGATVAPTLAPGVTAGPTTSLAPGESLSPESSAEASAGAGATPIAGTSGDPGSSGNPSGSADPGSPAGSGGPGASGAPDFDPGSSVGGIPIVAWLGMALAAVAVLLLIGARISRPRREPAAEPPAQPAQPAQPPQPPQPPSEPPDA